MTYVQELDLLYRLRFFRGVIPKHIKLTDPNLMSMVEEYSKLNDALEKLDAELLSLKHKLDESKPLTG